MDRGGSIGEHLASSQVEQTHCYKMLSLSYLPQPIQFADFQDSKRMDTEIPLVRAAHDRNDEILECIYIGRRFKNDTVRVALRSKTARKTVRALYPNDHPASTPEKYS